MYTCPRLPSNGDFVDLVRKAFTDVSGDSSVYVNGEECPAQKSDKGISYIVVMARLSHFALGESWEFFRPAMVRFY